MSRISTFLVFFLAVFLQGGAYGLTFLLPRLFDRFGADEKAVGITLTIATLSTLITVFYSGHLSDWFGRVMTLVLACISIAAAMCLFAMTEKMGLLPILASLLMGAGWGLTYALVPVVLTRLVSTDERIRFFAINSVVLMAGFGLSPVMTAEIEKAGGTIIDAFSIVSGLAVISALLFFILIKPVSKHALHNGPETSSRLSFIGIGTILRSRALLPILMVCLGACVFSSMNNFQTVFADQRGLDYANFFLIYTIIVVICRIVLARFKGGSSPYLTIAILQYIMSGSVLIFIFSGSNDLAYWCVAALFGIGYGASYPILAAMCANDADHLIVPQTLQLMALSYFIGIFGFPLIAGWIIVEMNIISLLIITCGLATLEATMAVFRSIKDYVAQKHIN